MKHEYMPKTLIQKLGYLVEECGETMAAVGKTLRWGLDSFNPEVPREKRESNRDWILREIRDLKYAIKLAEEVLCHKVECPTLKGAPVCTCGYLRRLS